MSQPIRSDQIVNCSTAAARNVSPAPRTTLLPDLVRKLASLPIEVVFPLPLTPTTKITLGFPDSDSARRDVLRSIVSCLLGDRLDDLVEVNLAAPKPLGHVVTKFLGRRRRPCRFGSAWRTTRPGNRRRPDGPRSLNRSRMSVLSARRVFSRPAAKSAEQSRLGPRGGRQPRRHRNAGSRNRIRRVLRQSRHGDGSFTRGSGRVRGCKRSSSCPIARNRPSVS